MFFCRPAQFTLFFPARSSQSSLNCNAKTLISAQEAATMSVYIARTRATPFPLAFPYRSRSVFSRAEFENLPAVDMHIHTVYSGHAAQDMTLANIVSRAEHAGLKQIAITEHVWNAQQLASLELLQEEFDRIEPSIKVYLGLEVDVDPRYADGRLIEQIPSEFRPLLIATHAYPDSSLMWYDDVRTSKRTKRRLLKKWFPWVTAAVQRDCIDVLAHPGVMLSREGPEVRFEAELLDRFTDLFGVMRAHGVAFELNEQVNRKLSSPEHQATYHNLPALAAELGVKLSVGSDSHELGQVGQFDWISQITRRAGLRPEHFFIYDGPGLVKGPNR